MSSRIIVAVNFRVADDPQGQKEGAWKEFRAISDADKWLVVRVNKTATSPKGRIVFTLHSLQDIPHTPADWPGFERMNESLQKAIVSYVRYKNRERF